MEVETIHKENWCTQDKHREYEYFNDFNEWLDNEERILVREQYNIAGLTQPSKALYAGDLKTYNQAFEEYRVDRRNEVLKFNLDDSDNDHWYDRNGFRFDQLVENLEEDTVVPFIGAGISVGGGFPTWEEHLRQQARTSGMDFDHVDKLLATGHFETIIDEIEHIRGREVFVQEIRDVFSRTGKLTDITLLLTELFRDTIITTNYDKLLEQAYDTGIANAYEVFEGDDAMAIPAPDKVTIHKIHGSAKTPAHCILSKNQYDSAYGLDSIDLSLPIPKLLSYYYRNSNLLFLGCSLNNDRTIQVFREVKRQFEDNIPQHFSIEEAPQTVEEIVRRNGYLLQMGITPIWFESKSYDKIEGILRLAKNELRYREIY
jgi:NAD-dependent SIR2 family protein deacetylase